jgi:hypothetical protein
MALHDRALVEAALFPPTSTVLTFVYCARHAKAPFGLSWLNFKELTRDPLCLEEKQFGRWLRSQERKKAHDLATHRRGRLENHLAGLPSLTRQSKQSRN